MNPTLSAAEAELELARAAAREFCRQFGFSPDQMRALAGPPLMEPTALDRDGRRVTAYRWLGGGRGGPYVQAEVEEDTGKVVVHGGFGHQEFGPWPYTP